jgi:AraC family transcriptional regulator
MAYDVVKKQIPLQPVLVIQGRVPRSGIADFLGSAFQKVFVYAQQNGITVTGAPLARYTEMTSDSFTIQAGFPVSSLPASSAEGSEVRGDTLPGGPVAFTVHMGPYDKLPEAMAAIGDWIKQQGLAPAGAPWESYVTDPASLPDPKDWKTEVFCPLAS